MSVEISKICNVTMLAGALMAGCGGAGAIPPVESDGSASSSTAASADLVIHHYFSPQAHGPTQVFRRWPAAGVVLHVKVDDSAGIGRQITARWLQFTGDDRTQQLERWINNQHSDGLYPDVREPQVVTPADSRLVSSARTGSETGPAGDKYEVYTLTLEVAAPAPALTGFSAAAQTVVLPVYRRMSP